MYNNKFKILKLDHRLLSNENNGSTTIFYPIIENTRYCTIQSQNDEWILFSNTVGNQGKVKIQDFKEMSNQGCFEFPLEE